MRLLVHICCGPCFLYPLEEMTKSHEITGFFYNPNIHPFQEYAKRLEAVEDYCRDEKISLIVDDYAIEDYFREVAFHEKEPERCRRCYHLRLARTAKFAEENGFDVFTSTLLVSPHQKHETIKEIGQSVSAVSGVQFLYQDFRPGYKRGVEKSRKIEMYRQKYCGCIFSERERFGQGQGSSSKLKNPWP